MSLETAFSGQTLHDRQMAAACLSGVWLRYDFLDESHTLSQSISTTTGSYWHGIMHRREPDYSNAKYWFRQVGRHPVFEPLAHDAAQLAADEKNLRADASFLTEQAVWDAFAFVDLCAAAISSDSSTERLCQRIQQQEARLLFDYCYRQAVGM